MKTNGCVLTIICLGLAMKLDEDRVDQWGLSQINWRHPADNQKAQEAADSSFRHLSNHTNFAKNRNPDQSTRIKQIS